MISRHRSVVAVLVLLVYCLLSPGVSIGFTGQATTVVNPEVAFVLEAMRAGLLRLSSAQYHATEVFRRFEDGKATSTVRTDYQFERGSGGKYRVEIDLRSNDRGKNPVWEIEAFNGEHYQGFRPKSEVLERASQPPAQTLRPPAEVFPYLFILEPPSRFDHPTLLNSPNWEKLAESASLKGRKHVAGHDCIVLELHKHLMTENWVCTVYVAEQLGFYPLGFELRGPNSMATLEVVSHEVFASPEGPIVFPTHVIVKDSERKHRVSTECEITVDLETLRINQPIPDERFTLDERAAAVLIDGDTGQTHILRQRARDLSVNRAVPAYTAALVLTAILASCYAIYALRRWWKQP